MTTMKKPIFLLHFNSLSCHPEPFRRIAKGLTSTPLETGHVRFFAAAQNDKLNYSFSK